MIDCLNWSVPLTRLFPENNNRLRARAAQQPFQFTPCKPETTLKHTKHTNIVILCWILVQNPCEFTLQVCDSATAKPLRAPSFLYVVLCLCFIYICFHLKAKAPERWAGVRTWIKRKIKRGIGSTFLEIVSKKVRFSISFGIEQYL